MGRGEAGNIKVIDKLALVVHHIDERASQVAFFVNPNIVDYRQTKQTQSISYEAIPETRLVKLAPDASTKIEIDGTVYTITVDAIGTTQESRRWSYCDFTVTWEGDSPSSKSGA